MERAGNRPETPRTSLLSGLSRITTSGKFIPEIDGLRFIAIASVVVFHLAEFLGPESYFPPSAPRTWGAAGAHVLGRGWLGVPLFFMISGFILALPFASRYLEGAHPVSLRAYLLRRVTRLEPPFLLSLALLYALKVLYRGEDPVRLLPHLLASSFYLHNLIYHSQSLINGVTWSLEIEVQFYLLAPLLARVYAIPGRMARRLVIVAAIASVVALHVYLYGGRSNHPGNLFHYIQYFLAGFLLADIYLVDWRRSPTCRRWWDLVGLACLAGAAVGFGGRVGDRIALPALFFLVAVSLFRGVLFRKAMTLPVVVTIGGMCYSIYLLHNPVILLVGRFTRAVATPYFHVNLVIQALLILPFVLLVSVVFFRLIERPCMRKDWPARASAAIRGWLFGPPTPPSPHLLAPLGAPGNPATPATSVVDEDAR